MGDQSHDRRRGNDALPRYSPFFNSKDQMVVWQERTDF